MAIGDRFSKQQFLMEAEQKPGTRELSELLQAEVLALLQGAIQARTSDIVGQLNQLGHYEPQPDHIAFRDDEGSDADYRCDLRVAVDVVISVGFRDSRDLPELE
jgi:hypothetical protein